LVVNLAFQGNPRKGCFCLAFCGIYVIAPRDSIQS
jgi:hypothetical protein